eukprot:CAMPEP_0204256722 /NCGR_PEP_ID=MMETSP0468-20130131/3958_1 /ASSEMBLY_ACC=CAM_ASM_000383 /TAXON_ID=2969 /ORGANISM="Oxyrrhis marina" /LENGTH=52 /DNA_ID=CAMNT_0051230715 /DNA_START=58 /DNA_END=212 /DNA_ORIENTATION=-
MVRAWGPSGTEARGVDGCAVKGTWRAGGIPGGNLGAQRAETGAVAVQNAAPA